jgi:HSP20 family protein
MIYMNNITFHQSALDMDTTSKKAQNTKLNFGEDDTVVEGFSPEVRELSVDVISKPTKITIFAQLAGVKKEEVDIVIDKDLLKIRTQQNRPLEVSDSDTMLAHECHWGEVFRPIILPIGLDTKKIQATMDNGLLSIEIPKSDEMRVRKITIK